MIYIWYIYIYTHKKYSFVHRKWFYFGAQKYNNKFNIACMYSGGGLRIFTLLLKIKWSVYDRIEFTRLFMLRIYVYDGGIYKEAVRWHDDVHMCTWHYYVPHDITACVCVVNIFC